MRQIISLNRKWAFTKEALQNPAQLPETIYWVNVPHCWNAIDGQDGAGDYYRGTCWYVKELNREEIPEAQKYYVEVRGANSSADLYVGGKKLCHHDGGYSTWRVDVTEALKESTVIAIAVDNSPSDSVYPQVADFTFYGGLYRDVNLICVPESHFDLDYIGAPGIAVTPVVDGKNAKVKTEVYLTGAKEGQTLRYTLKAACGCVVAQAEQAVSETVNESVIEDVTLWNGRKNPYLYTAVVELVENGEVIDTVSTRFGCRTFEIDPERGFILNGEEYPLRGVSRHQDRWGIGNALLPEHHEEDINFILEVGCTTIRLAHYQHDQYFYDLCDEKGLVIWAEIPYISNHMPGGRANTISQMKELIAQNYNHPSIVVWGLSNEITMKGAEDADLLENHEILNNLCHEMDKTRLTTMAIVSMCPEDSKYIQIPDIVSWNHYFGWYGGDTTMNGPWFDNFHAKYPNLPVGISEYGCEALNWHTSKPTQGDYTEEYQAFYHEELIKQIAARKYLWATHVWNMFDFGADNRAEGGENGQNHKGLMTFDRKYKKDSFYAYKAWLNPEPMVHICRKRYVDRVEDVTKVTVYSNQPEVELFANGESLGVQKNNGLPFFYFDVPNTAASTKLHAVAGECTDDSLIRKVETFNESYRLKEKGAILNWFDITAPEGYFSLNDKLSDIMASPEGMALFGQMFGQMMGGGTSKEASMGFEIDPSAMMKMMGGFTVIRLTNLMGAANVSFTKEQLLGLNAQLNQIKKPE
ncbi:MAG: glycoside hydrolase family 2 TIM barrel-domain containing protein [bacterium]|nr:glycoside hydrolase family 2 TIM barrel-domain containing protein [bacterium]